MMMHSDGYRAAHAACSWTSPTRCATGASSSSTRAATRAPTSPSAVSQSSRSSPGIRTGLEDPFLPIFEGVARPGPAAAPGRGDRGRRGEPGAARSRVGSRRALPAVGPCARGSGSSSTRSPGSAAVTRSRDPTTRPSSGRRSLAVPSRSRPAAPRRRSGVLAPAAGEIELLSWAGLMGEDEARGAGIEPARDRRSARRDDRGRHAGGGGGAGRRRGGAPALRGRRRNGGGRARRRGQPGACARHPGGREDALRRLRRQPGQRRTAGAARAPRRPARDRRGRGHGHGRGGAARRDPSPRGCTAGPACPSSRGSCRAARHARAESDRAAQAAIAGHVVDRVLDGRLCLVGPGTTTRAIMAALGLAKTVLGVDVLRGSELVESDADEERLLELLDTVPSGTARVVVTPVGGQGFLFGRGNQQLSPRVLERAGPRERRRRRDGGEAGGARRPAPARGHRRRGDGREARRLRPYRGGLRPRGRVPDLCRVETSRGRGRGRAG